MKMLEDIENTLNYPNQIKESIGMAVDAVLRNLEVIGESAYS